MVSGCEEGYHPPDGDRARETGGNSKFSFLTSRVYLPFTLEVDCKAAPGYFLDAAGCG
jgi:hypothetical protein